MFTSCYDTRLNLNSIKCTYYHNDEVDILLKKYIYRDIANIIFQYITNGKYYEQIGFINPGRNNIAILKKLKNTKHYQLNNIYPIGKYSADNRMQRYFKEQRDRLGNRLNHRLRTIGNTICKIHDEHSWIGINHFTNYYFQFIDIFDGYSKKIPINNDTDVGFVNGQVYIIERSFGVSRFKRFFDDEFITDAPTIYNRQNCVFATIDNKLYAIGGKNKLARTTIEVFNGKSWKLLNVKLSNYGACNDTTTIGTNIYIAKGHCYEELCNECEYCYYIEVYNTKTNTISTINLPVHNHQLYKILSINNKLICVYKNEQDNVIIKLWQNSHFVSLDTINLDHASANNPIKLLNDGYTIKYKNIANGQNILDYFFDGLVKFYKRNTVKDYYPY